MTIWIDAQLSPAIAKWISANFAVNSIAVRDVALRDANDKQIFMAAKSTGAVVMTKDTDFVQLLQQHGPPPLVIWLRCGNTSNKRLKEILKQTLQQAIDLLEGGERLVEIIGR